MHDDNNDDTNTIAATRREALLGLGALGVGLTAAASGAAHAAPGASAAAQKTSRELSGKVAIVTGARNNLGRGFAVALARMGADVLVHFHRAETRKEAEETAKLVRAQNVKAVLVDGDLSKLASVRKMFDAAQKQLGRVDIVVNNAGYIRKKPIAEITEAEFERAVGINTKGMFWCMQEAAKRIRDNGRVINIGTSLLGATTGM